MSRARRLVLLALLATVGLASVASGYHTYGVLIDTETVTGRVSVAEITPSPTPGSSGTVESQATPTRTPELLNRTGTATPAQILTPTPMASATTTTAPPPAAVATQMATPSSTENTEPAPSPTRTSLPPASIESQPAPVPSRGR